MKVRFILDGNKVCIFFLFFRVMGIYVYYHLTLLNNWRDIVREQCSRLVFSGLYHETVMIKCYAISPDMDSITECRELLKKYGNKFELIEHTDKGNEWFTLSHTNETTADDDFVLYIHTKGVTRYGTDTYDYHEGHIARDTGELTHHDMTFHSTELYRNICDWRDLMEYFLIARYDLCLSELSKGVDTIGINIFKYPPLHYAGNFFWIKGSFLKKLELEQFDHNPETWLFENRNGVHLSLYQSKFEIIPDVHLGISHYLVEYPLNKVVDNNNVTEDSAFYITWKKDWVV